MSQEIVKGEGGAKRGRKPRAQRRERTPLERARDRRLIARLHLSRPLWTHEDIAEEVNRLQYDKEAEERIGTGLEAPRLSKQMVSSALKSLRERLDAEAEGDIQTLRRIRIAQYEELAELCRERFDATVGKHIKTVVTDGEKASTRTEEEELAGESPFLTLAKACRDKILEIEGSLSPRKVAPTNPEGTKPYDAFSDSAELKRLKALYDDIGSSKP